MESSRLSSKIILDNNKFREIREALKAQGKRVMHCHGVFDLLHPGHIAHLQQAKTNGDVLVVSITSAPYVLKGPGRPYFSDEQRMLSLAAIECVDYVLLSNAVEAFNIIGVVQPDFYVKGSEYAKAEDDITGNITPEIECVRKYGGDVFFTTGDVYSSTKLINNTTQVLPAEVKEYVKGFSQKYSVSDIRKIVEEMKDIKVLVVGDIIVDEYVFCNVQGLMSKDRAFSARYLDEERYLGGSLAVARHLASFSNNVTVCAVVGEEHNLHSRILDELSGIMRVDLVYDKDFTTVVKKRYIERRGKREEYEKLFSINNLDKTVKEYESKPVFYKKLEKIIEDYDLVVVTDFGHGLIDDRAMEILQSKAKYLAVNCQTNSSNYGMNLITKYNRADTFTLDGREIMLAFKGDESQNEEMLRKLRSHLGSKDGWLTLGSEGAAEIRNDGSVYKCPAMTLSVQDTVGAGDAFFSVSSLCSAINAPKEVGLFLGNIAGAMAANILGNRESVDKVKILKYVSTLLNV